MLGLSDFELYRGNSTDSLHSNYEYRFALPFERVDDPVGMTMIFQRYWQHSITVSIIYYLLIRAIQWAMTDRKPFELKKTLFWWNAALAVFSIVGLMRFSEDLLHSLFSHGLSYAVCYSCHPNGVAAFWSLLFAISKFIELGDTLFIVLRKRPLIFLHYYHHAAVLVYTLHSGAEHTAAGRAFISMNFLAHSCMYSYYTAKAASIRVPTWIQMTVTVIQTTQMLGGVATSIHVLRLKLQDKMPCQQSYGNLALAFVIYITFAILFVQFFVNTYRRKKQKTDKKKEL